MKMDCSCFNIQDYGLVRLWVWLETMADAVDYHEHQNWLSATYWQRTLGPNADTSA